MQIKTNPIIYIHCMYSISYYCTLPFSVFKLKIVIYMPTQFNYRVTAQNK